MLGLTIGNGSGVTIGAHRLDYRDRVFYLDGEPTAWRAGTDVKTAGGRIVVDKAMLGAAHVLLNSRATY